MTMHLDNAWPSARRYQMPLRGGGAHFDVIYRAGSWIFPFNLRRLGELVSCRSGGAPGVIIPRGSRPTQSSPKASPASPWGKSLPQAELSNKPAADVRCHGVPIWIEAQHFSIKLAVMSGHRGKIAVQPSLVKYK